MLVLSPDSVVLHPFLLQVIYDTGRGGVSACQVEVKSY